MESKVTLYIVRHGKTMLNTLDRVQGWCDSFLTEEGIQVAQHLGKGLTDVHFDSVYTSDLRRTSQTAHIVLEAKDQLELPITELEGLREACFGTYEGDYNQRMWTDIGLYMHYRSLEDFYKKIASGEVTVEDSLDAIAEIEPTNKAETFKQVEARTQQALNQIADCESRKGRDVNVLIVSHGMSILAMLHNLGGGKLVKGHIDNVSVCKVIYKQGQFAVESMGDMTYVHKGRELISK